MSVSRSGSCPCTFEPAVFALLLDGHDGPHVVDGEDRSREELLAHVEACDPCRQRLRLARELEGVLANAGAELVARLDDGDAERLIDRVLEDVAVPRSSTASTAGGASGPAIDHRARPIWPVTLLAAAAALVFGVGLGVWLAAARDSGRSTGGENVARGGAEAEPRTTDRGALGDGPEVTSPRDSGPGAERLAAGDRAAGDPVAGGPVAGESVPGEPVETAVAGPVEPLDVRRPLSDPLDRPGPEDVRANRSSPDLRKRGDAGRASEVQPVRRPSWVVFSLPGPTPRVEMTDESAGLHLESVASLRRFALDHELSRRCVPAAGWWHSAGLGTRPVIWSPGVPTNAASARTRRADSALRASVETRTRSLRLQSWRELLDRAATGSRDALIAAVAGLASWPDSATLRAAVDAIEERPRARRLVASRLRRVLSDGPSGVAAWGADHPGPRVASARIAAARLGRGGELDRALVRSVAGDPVFTDLVVAACREVPRRPDGVALRLELWRASEAAGVDGDRFDRARVWFGPRAVGVAALEEDSKALCKVLRDSHHAVERERALLAIAASGRCVEPGVLVRSIADGSRSEALLAGFALARVGRATEDPLAFWAGVRVPAASLGVLAAWPRGMDRALAAIAGDDAAREAFRGRCASEEEADLLDSACDAPRWFASVVRIARRRTVRSAVY
jgi:hypothetical protein